MPNLHRASSTDKPFVWNSPAKYDYKIDDIEIKDSLAESTPSKYMLKTMSV